MAGASRYTLSWSISVNRQESTYEPESSLKVLTGALKPDEMKSAKAEA